MSEAVVRGAIVNELAVAARYAFELTALELRAEGVDAEEYGPLSFIGVTQPVTRTRLAEATGIRRTTLRDQVARLIEQGHVEELPNPPDGRYTLLRLTPAGQAIYDRGAPAFKRLLARMDEALDGGLHEHEESVRRVRVALQSLTEELRTARSRAAGR
jgi:DNA-binding MarR family transcriptional regulator